MKFARYVIVVIPLLIPVMSSAQVIQASPSNQPSQNSLLSDHPEWFTCQSYGDCTVVTDGLWCKGVNKKYENQLNNLILTKHDIPGESLCVDADSAYCDKNKCDQINNRMGGIPLPSDGGIDQRRHLIGI
jgi:hypothetical protein